jgi:hypothetical protein
MRMRKTSPSWEALPPHLVGALERYYSHGVDPGDFLREVLSNSLLGAFGRADDANTRLMRHWAAVLYNDLPGDCHGSPEVVRAWMERGGYNGRSGS